jgi:hypothetical protein
VVLHVRGLRETIFDEYSDGNRLPRHNATNDRTVQIRNISQREYYFKHKVLVLSVKSNVERDQVLNLPVVLYTYLNKLSLFEIILRGSDYKRIES